MKPSKVKKVKAHKEKVVASHYYTGNKRHFRVLFSKTPRKTWGIHNQDVLVIDFDGMKVGVRPDEAIMLIHLLSTAVFNVVSHYKLGLLKELIPSNKKK